MKRIIITTLVGATLFALTSPLAGVKVKDLPAAHREWLEEVDLLISKAERAAFLALEKDYQRDAFIRRFWEVRDPDPATPDNELKGSYYARREEAQESFGDLKDDRARFFILHGPPGTVIDTDCGLITWPLEIWRYGYSATLGGGFTALFYQPGAGGRFRLWRPGEGQGVLLSRRPSAGFYETLDALCSPEGIDVEDLIVLLQEYERAGALGPVAAEAPPAIDPEWLQTFQGFTTDIAPETRALPASLGVDFAGRRQSRVIVRGRLAVPADGAAVADLSGRRSYNFQLTGEVLRQGELFESFRYRFDLPVTHPVTADLPVIFERLLRPGDYTLIVKLEDLNGGGLFRESRDLAVPALRAAEAGDDEAVPAAIAEAAAEEIEPAIELVSHDREIQSGQVRFSAVTSGESIAKVRFLLDDKPVLTKTRPPFSVELDLGSLPTSHTVRVVAFDASGAEIATDAVLLNAGEHAFVARLIEPRQGETHDGEVRVRVEVQAPPEARVERVEVFLDDDRVATLFQPPWEVPIPLTGSGLVFIRAVAYLDDGNSTEDFAVINSPNVLESLSVRMVELYATVRDGAGRPVLDLAKEEFTVLDQGEAQEILRFDRLEDLPIYATLLVDTSASMADNLDRVRSAALKFFEDSITPRDRAAVITFSEQPQIAARFTNDLNLLAGALAGLSAERSTALYDSLLYSLFYFKGVKGQKALLVLSDGKDRKSEKSFDEVLRFARGSGVTVYAIGLEGAGSDRVSRKRLATLAEETGGSAYFIRTIDELAAIYQLIQQDLRSRYLLAYQIAGFEEGILRQVEVRVARPAIQVRSLSGYIP